MKEIKPLTSLRAFAAFLVFMFHYANVYLPVNRGVDFCCEWIPFTRLWQQGYVGVSIFFVLSGFLITRIYFDGVVHRTKSLRMFFVKRVARIWPLFLVYTVIQHAGLVWQGTPITSDFWVTMTMTQGFFFDLRYQGLPTAWSLTVEESFYVFAPLFFLAIAAMAPAERKDNADHGPARILRVLLAVLGVAVVMILIGEGLTRFLREMGWNWNGLMGNHYHLWHATLFGRMPEFAIGVFCAFLHRNGWTERHISPRAAGWWVLIAFAGIGACMWGKSYTVYRPEAVWQLTTYGLSYLLTLLTGVLILALTVDGNRIHRFLGWEPFVYLGKTSYGFYLVQITVMIAPMVWLTDRLGWARLPVLYVLANLFCAATYQWVEVPARLWIIDKWGGRK